MVKSFSFSILILCSLTIIQYVSAGPVLEPFNSSQEKLNISQSDSEDSKVLTRIKVDGEELNLKLKLKDLDINNSIYDYVLVGGNGWPIRPQAADQPYFQISFEGEYRLVPQKVLTQKCNPEEECLERFDEEISFGEQNSSKEKKNKENGSEIIEPDQVGSILTYSIIGIMAMAIGSFTFLKIAQKRLRKKEVNLTERAKKINPSEETLKKLEKLDESISKFRLINSYRLHGEIKKNLNQKSPRIS